MDPGQDLRTTPLRADLIKPHFEIDTKWYVITGAPCSGKTTVLKELGARGIDWNPEVARVFIEEQQATGRTLEQIRG